jgi:hypothetical protein
MTHSSAQACSAGVDGNARAYQTRLIAPLLARQVTLKPCNFFVALSHVVCAAGAYLVDGRLKPLHLCAQLSRRRFGNV